MPDPSRNNDEQLRKVTKGEIPEIRKKVSKLRQMGVNTDSFMQLKASVPVPEFNDRTSSLPGKRLPSNGLYLLDAGMSPFCNLCFVGHPIPATQLKERRLADRLVHEGASIHEMGCECKDCFLCHQNGARG